MRPDRPRVLLLWPGGLFSGGANFGVPQLLSMAGALRAGTEAIVEIVDLDMEVAFGPIDLRRLMAPGYDLVGISCYSSYDYLKVMAIAAQIRDLLPKAWLVTGGYHPSARPDDFTGADSPFDYVVVGDGERPLCRLVAALTTGRRPLTRVLGPESVPDPNELPPYDWSLLERYRPIARRRAGQAEIYLSRGCPYDCAFCMERAKRDVSWRALEPERAVEEMHRLDAFLDLRGWTLFIADALFGMKQRWRREFLELLARRPVRAEKVWLLVRIDLLDREDLELMARANIAPGFGLETGDPDHLRSIRKAGKLGSYLEQMMQVASWARELSVPFGANMIVGHPGETEATLQTTARYLRKLFLEPKGNTGFVSVDPFRLYPGSPIDEERPEWEARTGMKIHRYPWWKDGDQDFLSEWVDPSASLDFRTTLRLRRELFQPIVSGIAAQYAYAGPAPDYFRRAIDEQVELLHPSRILRTLGMLHLWRGLTGASSGDETAGDVELATIAREAREATMVSRALSGDERLMAALVEVPRERFVRTEDIAESADDVALDLSDDGGSTISALHAYLATFGALDLGPGDHLVDLGGGTGYGAALAARVVGPTGSVLTIELQPSLSARAAELLATTAGVTTRNASAHETSLWAGATKVAVGFALRELPRSFVDALAPGGVLVAPIGDVGRQILVRIRKGIDGAIHREELHAVRYVPDRSRATV